ncbi:MAG TPA: Hsp20/alpha crystallin family protein [Acetobacteraceae bacterium]|nr:Hsp20/alpha crystallin family protein [Acetobacteraceae bacterium]
MSGFEPFTTLHREMNRLFDDALRGWPSAPASSGGGGGGGGGVMAPRMNVSETENEIRVEAELPGVSEKDVNIELSDDLLTIRGEKQAQREDKNQNYHIVERSFGSFARSIRLPFSPQPDQVKAEFANGVLHIALPKSAAQDKVHRIQVQPSSGGAAQGRTIQAQGGAGQGGSGASQSGQGAQQSGGKTA